MNIARKIQEIAINIAIKTVGKSVPTLMYEKKVPKEVIDKMRKEGKMLK